MRNTRLFQKLLLQRLHSNYKGAKFTLNYGHLFFKNFKFNNNSSPINGYIKLEGHKSIHPAITGHIKSVEIQIRNIKIKGILK